MSQSSLINLNRIKITADDWGMSPSINDAILDLCKRRVVSRVALLAGTKYFDHGLDDLKNVSEIEFGIHFNLSYGPAPWKGLRGFLWNALRSRAADFTQIVQSEWERQLEFLRGKNLKIKFFNSHEHVHVWPSVLPALVGCLRKAVIHEVRIPYDAELWLTTKCPLLPFALSARRFCQAEGLKTRPFYYPQARERRNVVLWKRKLESLDEGTEMLVHPSIKDDSEQYETFQSYRTGRSDEYRFLTTLGP